jgi:hypothetical protein
MDGMKNNSGFLEFAMKRSSLHKPVFVLWYDLYMIFNIHNFVISAILRICSSLYNGAVGALYDAMEMMRIIFF